MNKYIEISKGFLRTDNIISVLKSEDRIATSNTCGVVINQEPISHTITVSYWLDGTAFDQFLTYEREEIMLSDYYLITSGFIIEEREAKEVKEKFILSTEEHINGNPKIINFYCTRLVKRITGVHQNDTLEFEKEGAERIKKTVGWYIVKYKEYTFEVRYYYSQDDDYYQYLIKPADK